MGRHPSPITQFGTAWLIELNNRPARQIGGDARVPSSVFGYAS